MKTFKQKALEALESLVAQDVPWESKIINIHNNTVHLCISRIEAIEEDEASMECDAELMKELFRQYL